MHQLPLSFFLSLAVSDCLSHAQVTSEQSLPDDDMHERISGRVDAQKCQPQAPLADSQVANDMGQWAAGTVGTVWESGHGTVDHTGSRA